jgi:integrase/recombinase XerD
MQKLIDTFLAHLSADGATPASTLKAYRTDLTQCVTFLTDRGITDIQALQADDLEAFCAWLGIQGYAKATIARRIVALRSFSAFLCETGLLPDDLCAELHPPVVSRTLRATMTLEQIGALRECMLRDNGADGWRNRAMLEVLLATALRTSDLVALNVGDIALEAATVTARGRGGKIRTLALTPAAVMALAAYLQIARPKLLRAQDSQPALFLNHQGERLTRQGCWVVLKQHARQLGLDDVTPELLRQSVAAQRFADGATVDEVQVLLGHAVRKTTAMYQISTAAEA